MCVSASDFQLVLDTLSRLPPELNLSFSERRAVISRVLQFESDDSDELCIMFALHRLASVTTYEEVREVTRSIWQAKHGILHRSHMVWAEVRTIQTPSEFTYWARQRLHLQHDFDQLDVEDEVDMGFEQRDCLPELFNLMMDGDYRSDAPTFRDLSRVICILSALLYWLLVGKDSCDTGKYRLAFSEARTDPRVKFLSTMCDELRHRFNDIASSSVNIVALHRYLRDIQPRAPHPWFDPLFGEEADLEVVRVHNEATKVFVEKVAACLSAENFSREQCV